MTSAIVWETVLRLVGAFYALTAPFVLRVAAGDAVLDAVLDALGSKTPPAERRAERIRRVILVTNSILIGVGGVWLMALSSIATAVFVVCAASYAAYVFVIAPRFLDPYDEPDEAGRRQTRNALFVYLVATALVVAAQAGGLLLPWRELSPAAIWLAAGLSALIPAYAAWLFFGRRLSSERNEDAGPFDEDLPQIDPDPQPAAWRALLVPTWDRGPLVDPLTFETVYDIEGVEITDDLHARMGAWQALFMEIADPHDPLRQRLLQPERQTELEAAGRAIHESFLRMLPPDRISCEPLPRPHLPAVFPAAIKLMTDYGCHPLWHAGGEEVGTIDPCDLGLSHRLTQDLLGWADEFEWSVDWKDPGGPPLWSEERFAEHDRRGAALAERLRDELRRTGRGDVPVHHQPPPTDAA